MHYCAPCKTAKEEPRGTELVTSTTTLGMGQSNFIERHWSIALEAHLQVSFLTVITQMQQQNNQTGKRSQENQCLFIKGGVRTYDLGNNNAGKGGSNECRLGLAGFFSWRVGRRVGGKQQRRALVPRGKTLARAGDKKEESEPVGSKASKHGKEEMASHKTMTRSTADPHEYCATENIGKVNFR